MIATKTEQREAKGKALATGLLVAALMVACLLLAATPAHAKTFGVNSTKDREDERPGNGRCSTGVRIVHKDGGIEPECTLRAAIQEANATTQADTINFNILRRKGTNCDANTRVCTISPSSQLPAITEPVTISGYSQPGAKVNTATTGTNAVLKIVIDGSKAPRDAIGLLVTGSNVTVKGLVINNGFNTGVVLFPEGNQPGGNRLEGSFIGTDATGTTASPNLVGVFPTGIATGKNEVVGGDTLAARNLISGNRRSGVDLFSLATVEGNLIGTKKDGTTALDSVDFHRQDSGVQVVGPGNNTIGGNGAARNTIAFNGVYGVEISGADSTGNRVLNNSIFENGLLGIDLVGGIAANVGPNANDPQDPDAGPNRLQNYPAIASAQRSLDGSTTITGRLNSVPGETFTIRFFSNPAADPSGFGEGKTFLGEIQVTTDGQGNASFDFPAQGAVSEGEFVTATATRVSTGDTSEFSEAERVEGPVIGG
jgi:trimeric autotransporter adhesin